MLGNRAKRPLDLTVIALDEPSGRSQPQFYDFNPLDCFETFRNDVAGDLSAYMGRVEQTGMSAMKVIREGDLVTMKWGDERSYERNTLSLSQGCNPNALGRASAHGLAIRRARSR